MVALWFLSFFFFLFPRLISAVTDWMSAIAQLRQAMSSQLKHVSTIWKNFKQHYILHMSPQYGELQRTSGWDRFVSLGHSSKFQRLLRLAFVTAATLLTGGQPHFARCLAVSCAATLHIYFWGLLPPDRILPVAKFTLRPSLAFSCVDYNYWYWHLTSIADS